jgi:hypothetical protein
MIVYLNFDGVLHPDSVVYREGCRPTVVSEDTAALEHVDVLSNLLAPHGEIKLVLNTWWTFYLGLDACIRLLPAPLGCRVIDSTLGPAPNYDGLPNRSDEAEKHITQQGRRRLIILDHSNARYRVELLSHLVLVDPDLGLASETARSCLARRLENEMAARPTLVSYYEANGRHF